MGMVKVVLEGANPVASTLPTFPRPTPDSTFKGYLSHLSAVTNNLGKLKPRSKEQNHLPHLLHQNRLFLIKFTFSHQI